MSLVGMFYFDRVSTSSKKESSQNVGDNGIKTPPATPKIDCFSQPTATTRPKNAEGRQDVSPQQSPKHTEKKMLESEDVDLFHQKKLSPSKKSEQASATEISPPPKAEEVPKKDSISFSKVAVTPSSKSSSLTAMLSKQGYSAPIKTHFSSVVRTPSPAASPSQNGSPKAISSASREKWNDQSPQRNVSKPRADGTQAKSGAKGTQSQAEDKTDSLFTSTF